MNIIFKVKNTLVWMITGAVIVLSAGSLQAALSGTYTIGSGGSYATFTDAAAALNSEGVSGNVVFNVISGVYTEQFEINVVNGVSAGNQITFQAQSGNAADVTLQFSPTAGANYIIRLNGTDYVTIQNMTFTASGASYGRIIVLGDNADNNTISNCLFNGAVIGYASDNFAGIYCVPPTNTSDATTVSENTFTYVSVGVSLNGVNTITLASGTRVVNNTFSHVRRGVVLNYQLAPVISGNMIQSDGDRGIEVSYGNGALQITKNKIDVANTYGIYTVYCVGGTPPAGTPGLTANNFITVRAESGRGIYNLYANYQNFYHNSINMIAGTNSRAFEDYGSTGNINVVNNILASPAGGYAYVVNTPAAIVTSNYNDMYTSGNYIGYWNGNNIINLAAWRSASSKDANSRSVYPNFVSDSDLHSVAPWLNGVGTSLASVTDDIDGEARGGSPDIGADQFTPDAATTTPLSGSFTVGSGGNYASLTAAASDLVLKGISGPVTLNLLNGTFLEQVTFLEVPGATASDTITVKSNSGNPDNVTMFYAATGDNDNWVLRFYGADFFRVRNLTLTANNNPSPARGRVITLVGGVENLTVAGNVLNGSPIGGVNANFDIIYGANLVSSNTTNTLTPRIIAGNTFNNGSSGIYLDGLAYNVLASGTQIVNNTFSHVRRGVVLNYQLAPVISGNMIQSDGDRGIEVSYGNGALQITKNKIDVANTYGIYTVYCVGGTPPAGTPGLTANNFITVRAESGRGIYNLYANYQNFYHNSINMIAGTNSRAFEDYGSTGNINVVNNILASPAGGYAYVVNTPAAIVTSNYNDMYTSGNYIGYWNGNNIINLAAWRSASSKDANSRSVYPNFVSDSDLHSVAPWLNGVGTSLASVTDDIDGEARGGSPDIGADQFTPDAATTTPLSGSFTVGSGGNYASLTAAASDLVLKGISGPVTLNLLNGTFLEQVTFLEVPGATASDTITVKSNSGNPDNVTMFYAATGDNDNWVLRFYGADFFRVRNLTLTANNNPSPARGRVITLVGGVENLTVAGNVLNGSPIGGVNANFDIIYGANLVSSNTTNTLTPRIIAGNTFNNGSSGIYLDGLAYNVLASGTQIVNNTFSHVRRGVVLNYQLAPVISGNMIQSDGDRGIEVSYGNGALQITKNKIDVANTYGIYTVYCVGGTPPAGTPGLTANNFITVRAESGRGIYNLYANYQNFYHNSINMIAGTNSRAFEDYGSTGNINVVNNILASPAGGYAYVVNTPAAIATCDNNDLYTSGAKLAYWNGDRADLAALQAASQKDANSLATNPGYNSATDLHATSALIDSAGTPLADVPDDIDGNPRDALYPSIGASEIKFGVSGLDNGGKLVTDLLEIPKVFELHQNYPNPFNPETMIQFDLPKASQVTLKIYNMLGEQVQVLVDSEMPAGKHLVQWNGQGMASGTYFYIIQANEFKAVKRMMLIK